MSPAADALRYACCRSASLDVASATEYSCPAFLTSGTAFASARNSDSEKLVYVAVDFLAAPATHSTDITHIIARVVLLIGFPFFLDLKTKTVLIMHYGISIVTLKNLWSELVGY